MRLGSHVAVAVAKVALIQSVICSSDLIPSLRTYAPAAALKSKKKKKKKERKLFFKMELGPTKGGTDLLLVGLRTRTCHWGMEVLYSISVY